MPSRAVLTLNIIFLATIAVIPRIQAQTLPDAPSALLQPQATDASPVQMAYSTSEPTLDLDPFRALFPDASSSLLDSVQQASSAPQDPQRKHNILMGDATDENGNAIPLERQQPHRILGIMPNFRTVSAGSKPHPPGWKYNFTVATHQATDYSTFIFLGLTSLTAEGLNSHPALGKGADGFYAYTWRGFLDKTDGTYLSAWLLASALHEDTRYYPLGSGHSVVVRTLYIISRQGVARTYGGHQTPNIAGLGGKVLTQIISKTYYPPSAADFSVLATKFGYSVMRDVGFSAIREFYPDIAAHYIRKHRDKAAAMAAHDAAASGATP